jgi:hypothetical protein
MLHIRNEVEIRALSGFSPGQGVHAAPAPVMAGPSLRAPEHGRIGHRGDGPASFFRGPGARVHFFPDGFHPTSAVIESFGYGAEP